MSQTTLEQRCLLQLSAWWRSAVYLLSRPHHMSLAHFARMDQKAARTHKLGHLLRISGDSYSGGYVLLRIIHRIGEQVSGSLLASGSADETLRLWDIDAIAAADGNVQFVLSTQRSQNCTE